ncbi:MAG: MurR/RpiR family transcriptional regulator [Ilumatobacteraceae bacterium]
MTTTAEPTLALLVSQRIDQLTTTDRRIARFLLDDPGAIAFGTAASFADLVGAGVGSVHRLAIQLGYSGFSDLQSHVQGEISQRLRPAAEKIKTASEGDVVAVAMETEIGNISQTLTEIDRASLGSAVNSLADESITVYIVSGNSSSGIALHLSEELRLLRDGITLLTGNPVSLSAQIAVANKGDVLIAIDFHRYDKWLIDLVKHAIDRGLDVISITDSILAPFANLATSHFTVSARSNTPFDSHVGTLALCAVLVGSVATVLRRDASRRLDAVEKDWTGGDHLTSS